MIPPPPRFSSCFGMGGLVQAWIGTLGKGVMNVTLNSSYANRDNDHYKDELGATLANLCRIVPGGMLVFFST